MNQDEWLEKAMSFLPVLIRLNRYLSQRVELRDDFHIPPTQIYTLVLLNTYGTQSMSQLSKSLFMQRQQMTQIVESLVKKGLVARKTDPANRRLVLIDLTEQGKPFLIDLLTSHTSQLSNLLSLLGEEQRDRFMHCLNTIAEILANIETNHYTQTGGSHHVP